VREGVREVRERGKGNGGENRRSSVLGRGRWGMEVIGGVGEVNVRTGWGKTAKRSGRR
jgi:hypothetical protein